MHPDRLRGVDFDGELVALPARCRELLGKAGDDAVVVVPTTTTVCSVGVREERDRCRAVSVAVPMRSKAAVVAEASGIRSSEIAGVVEALSRRSARFPLRTRIWISRSTTRVRPDFQVCQYSHVKTSKHGSGHVSSEPPHRLWFVCYTRCGAIPDGSVIARTSSLGSVRSGRYGLSRDARATESTYPLKGVPG